MEWLTWLITTWSIHIHVVINYNNVHSMDVIMLVRSRFHLWSCVKL